MNEAVQYLKDKGLAGFSDFNNNKDARWVWKDSYVFVYSCRDNVMLGHPLRPEHADEIAENRVGSTRKHQHDLRQVSRGQQHR